MGSRRAHQIATGMGIKVHRGFTLIEISVVLVIMSLLLGGILAVVNAQLENVRLAATKSKLEAGKTALVSFLIRNNRLPCPAVPTLTSAVAAYGQEAATPGTCTAAVVLGAGVNTVVRGVLPWKSLGIADEAALDAFGRRLTYQVVLTETNRTATTVSGLRGVINVYNAAGGALVNPGNPATLLIVAHGNNGYGAYLPVTGARVTVPATPDEAENTDLDADYVEKDYSNTVANPFDDLLAWMTPGQLVAALTQTGATQSPQGIVNARLATVRDTMISFLASDVADPDGAGARTLWRRLPYADCTAIADGIADIGCVAGTVPWVTIGLPQATATDPWGAIIRYTPLAGMVANLTPSAAGLTLVAPAPAAAVALLLRAYGPDGIAATADDVTLSMSVAELRGSVLAKGIAIN